MTEGAWHFPRVEVEARLANGLEHYASETAAWANVKYCDFYSGLNMHSPSQTWSFWRVLEGRTILYVSKRVKRD